MREDGEFSLSILPAFFPLLVEGPAMAKSVPTMSAVPTSEELLSTRPEVIQQVRGGPPQAPWGAIMVYLTPALFVYAAFTIYPVVLTFYNSFHVIKPRGVEEYVGLANFVTLFTQDPTFWKAVANTMIWATVAPVADVGVGLILALCLYAKVPFGRFFRVAWFTPVLISYVVVGILWMWIYNYDWGVANQLLRAVGLGAWAHSWLGDPATALWALIFTHNWKWTGFNMVVCLAALFALPSEVLEAAELDNCGWVRKLAYIIIPMLRATLLNLLILSFVGKMKVFDLVWIMTGGGPGIKTEVLPYMMFRITYSQQNIGMGTASSIVILILAAAMVIPYSLWAMKKWVRV